MNDKNAEICFGILPWFFLWVCNVCANDAKTMSLLSFQYRSMNGGFQVARDKTMSYVKKVLSWQAYYCSQVGSSGRY
jgi:hypothetical protein